MRAELEEFIRVELEECPDTMRPGESADDFLKRANSAFTRKLAECGWRREDLIRLFLMTDHELFFNKFYGDQATEDVFQTFEEIEDEEITRIVKNRNAYEVFRNMPYTVAALGETDTKEFERKLKDLEVCGREASAGFEKYEALKKLGKDAGLGGDELFEMPLVPLLREFMSAKIYSSIEVLEPENSKGFLVMNGREWFSGEERRFYTGVDAGRHKGEFIVINEEYTDIAPRIFGYGIEKDNARKDEVQGIEIREGVKRIWEYAFSGCQALRNISLPRSLSFIGNRAFENCPSLSEIRIPDRVSVIGEGAFANCYGLKKIKLPRQLERIDYDLFKRCDSLERVTVPQSVSSIESRAFRDCSCLRRVDIPQSVRDISGEAFSRCENVTIHCISEDSYAYKYAKKHGMLVVCEVQPYLVHRSKNN